VLDSLNAALKVAESGGSEAIKQGLLLSTNQFNKILQEVGVEEIEAKGNFNPQVHEAVEVVGGRQDNKIVEVVEKGYRLGSKILRPAKVKVEKKKAEAKPS
jgi:molecular chaperone GrpE